MGMEGFCCVARQPREPIRPLGRISREEAGHVQGRVETVAESVVHTTEPSLNEDSLDSVVTRYFPK